MSITKRFTSIVLSLLMILSLFAVRAPKNSSTYAYSGVHTSVIDDGSTDGSERLCDKWAELDSRIIVVHKDNGGVSSARNIALEMASGEYVTFVDSDDFIAPDTYSANMKYLIEHKDVDILQFPYCNYINDEEKLDFHTPPSSLLEGPEAIFRNWWSGTPLEYVSWNKLYKRNIWNDIRFNIGHTSEDTCLVADFVKRANKVYISECGLYYYQRARENSYTYQYGYDKHMDLFYAHVAIYQCFNMFPYMVSEKVLAFTRLYRRLITAKQTDMSEDIQDQLLLIKKYYPSWREIILSKHTEKLWLSIAKILGANLFVKMFLNYLK